VVGSRGRATKWGKRRVTKEYYPYSEKKENVSYMSTNLEKTREEHWEGAKGEKVEAGVITVKCSWNGTEGAEAL